MKTFPLVVSSPEGDLFRDDILKISVRGAEGDLAVMAGHIPFVTSVKPCDCSIHQQNGEVKTAHTDGGILTVSEKSAALLTGSFQWID